jgi:hypothetical protein
LRVAFDHPALLIPKPARLAEYFRRDSKHSCVMHERSQYGLIRPVSKVRVAAHYAGDDLGHGEAMASHVPGGIVGQSVEESQRVGSPGLFQELIHERCQDGAVRRGACGQLTEKARKPVDASRFPASLIDGGFDRGDPRLHGANDGVNAAAQAKLCARGIGKRLHHAQACIKRGGGLTEQDIERIVPIAP